MAWNKNLSMYARGFVGLGMAFMAVGCTVMKDRESPINKVTSGSPTVLDVYRGSEVRPEADKQRSKSAQDKFRETTDARQVNRGDEITQRYWSAVEPMNQRFARVPNPDLVMVVFPHLARGEYPIPGYVTVFPMYQKVEYALPGEVPDDLLAWRASYFDNKAQSAGKNPNSKDQSQLNGGGTTIMPLPKMTKQSERGEQYVR